MSYLAHSKTSADYYSLYPVGFGDTTTGLNLVGGVSLALRHRSRTGKGSAAHVSLLNMGLWVMAATLSNETIGNMERSS
jgi:crotonobetainyl-CoA:carnitine CoA-transferase CaiB-like acyl-CoA transferase